MKEKEIIKAKLKSSKKFKKIYGIICLIILVLGLSWAKSVAKDEIENACIHCYEGFEHYCSTCDASIYGIWFMYAMFPGMIIIFCYSSIILIIGSIWDSIELTVTNKRVYGKAAFGKIIDLPLDSISSIGIINLFDGVFIATSSGSVSFRFMENHKEIYNAVSTLLVERQKNKTIKSTNENYDYIEELKKLKELLNEGIITQEEFDKKKKELL